MRPRYPGWLQGLLVILVPAILILLTYMNYQFVLESQIGNEFLVGWTSAKGWIEEGISPYDPVMREEVQRSIYGRSARPESGEFQGFFTSPHPALFFYVPFSLLSFEIARALWMTLAEIGVLLLVIIGHRLARWSPNRFLLIGLFLFSLIWYHGARVTLMGSHSTLVAILVGGAVLAIQKDNDWIAGLMLALAMIQPNLVNIVVAFVCLWTFSRRRWQFLISLFGFIFLIFGASTLMSPSWPFEWVSQTIDLLNSNMSTSAVSIVAAQFARNSSWIRIAAVIVLGIYLLWEWIQAWGEDEMWFTWTASMTISISLLIVPLFSTDGFVILLPILVMLFGHWVGRWGIGGQIVAWLTILIFGIGLWAFFFRGLMSLSEPPALYFLVPLLCILGLIWVRWWVTSRRQGFLRSSSN